jgi:lipoprotein-anchoring transpeptidase ErfK/SrfK
MRGYNPPRMIRHSLLVAALAALLLAGAPGAGAQGFGSISSGGPAWKGATPAEQPAASVTPAPAASVAVPFGSAGSATNTAPVAAPPAASSPPATAVAPAAAALATPAPAANTTVPFGSVGSSVTADTRVPRSDYETADRIVVKKSERRLYLLRANQAIAEYPIRLGLNPNGHKLREGDFRTPEGTYELVRRNPRSDFFMSIEVSYPNDADRARAKQLGVKPGGLIMIHGLPNVLRKSPEYYANFDWTNGCIAVSNSDMVDIWLRTGLGTPVEIRP